MVMTKKKIDAFGAVAKKMSAELQTDNAARKERKQLLRNAVMHVRAVYRDSSTAVVNGQKTWSDWCRWACPNPKTKDPTRWFQIVLGEKKDPNGVRVKTVRVEPGMVLVIGGDKYVLDKVSVSGRALHGIVSEYVQESKKEEQPVEILHAKGHGWSTRQAECEKHMPNRKLRGKKFAENREDVTCRECRKYVERAAAKLKPSVEVVIAPEIKEAVIRQKANLALGLPRVGSACPDKNGECDGTPE